MAIPALSTATKRWTCPNLAQATRITVVLGLLWRTVRFALAFPLWGDEAFVALNFLTRDFAGLSQPLEFFQIAPPGFLWAEWLVVHALGPSERALRLVPYLAGVASLVVFWRFCRLVTTRRTVLVAVAFFAASFYPVRHATEVKPYAIDLLISMVLTSLGWLTWRDIRSYRYWPALFVATIVGVWCSYTAVFPAAGVAFFLGAKVVRQRSLGLAALWLAYGLSMTLSWAVMFVTFGGPQARAAAFLPDLYTWRNAFPPLERPWRIPWWLLDIHTGQMLAYPHGGHDFGSTATALLVVAGCIRMGRRPARRPLLLLLLGPLPVALVAAALHRYPYGTSTRTMLYMAPAFCLLAGEGTIAVLRVRHRLRRGPTIAAGALASLLLIFMAVDVAKPYVRFEDREHRRLARWLAARAVPGDEWVVFNGATPVPLIKDLMRMPWLQKVGVARFYLFRDSPVPTRWQPDPETVAPNPRGRTWLIVQNHGDDDYFPKDRLAAYQRALDARLGPPQSTTRFALPDHETWTISVY